MSFLLSPLSLLPYFLVSCLSGPCAFLMLQLLIAAVVLPLGGCALLAIFICNHIDTVHTSVVGFFYSLTFFG